MKQIIYIETTIVSLLVARPSRDIVMAGHQAETRQWWNEKRGQSRCVTSDEVLREASRGDPEMVRLRLGALNELPVLEVDERVLTIAGEVIRERILPPTASSDAIHATMAAMHGASILLTWNCRHLANPDLLPRFRKFMERHGFELPEVCTPVELLADSNYES